MKKRIGIIYITCLLVILTACNSGKQEVEVSSHRSENKIMVQASFHAIAEFAKAVGGDKVNVEVVIANGTEPHDYEPKAKDIARLNEADVFVYNGLGMESWLDEMLATVDNGDLVKVDTSSGAALLVSNNSEEQGVYDPHIWLSPKAAQLQARNIMNAFIKLDPRNKAYYKKNFADFSTKLEALYKEYSKKFSTIKNKSFVTGHAAFAYLCKDFGLQQNSVEDVFAEGETSPRRLEELVDYCRTNKIKTIFMEEMASPKISETLAREVDAKVVRILTAESNEKDMSYVESMEYNLRAIYQSLK